MCCSVLQCVAVCVCRSVYQCDTACWIVWFYSTVAWCVLVCCSVRVAVSCSVLQCVAVWASVLLYIQFLTKFYFFEIFVNVVMICSHVSGALYHGTGRQWGHSETAQGRWSVYIDVVVCVYVYMYIRTRKYVYTNTWICIYAYTYVYILKLVKADDRFTFTL